MRALGSRKEIRKVALQWKEYDSPDWELDSCLPLHASQSLKCAKSYAVHDLMSMLVNPQVEPSFGGLIKSDSDLPLWCLLGIKKSAVHNLLQYTGHSKRQSKDYLCLSFTDPDAEKQAIEGLLRQGHKPLKLSQWKRDTQAPGTVLIIDEAKWIPAVSASANAIHLMDAERYTFWQVMASGKPVSVGEAFSEIKDSVSELNLPKYELFADVEQYWCDLLNTPFEARKAGDRLRNAFWQERRSASANVDDFLERVFNW